MYRPAVLFHCIPRLLNRKKEMPLHCIALGTEHRTQTTASQVVESSVEKSVIRNSKSICLKVYGVTMFIPIEELLLSTTTISLAPPPCSSSNAKHHYIHLLIIIKYFNNYYWKNYINTRILDDHFVQPSSEFAEFFTSLLWNAFSFSDLVILTRIVQTLNSNLVR
jgi:hypothetical protein